MNSPMVFRHIQYYSEVVKRMSVHESWLRLDWDRMGRVFPSSRAVQAKLPFVPLPFTVDPVMMSGFEVGHAHMETRAYSYVR